MLGGARIAVAQPRSRSPIAEAASNSPSARMPASGVRMSCASSASAASIARAARDAGAACAARARLGSRLGFRHAFPAAGLVPRRVRAARISSSPISRRMSAGVAPPRAQLAQRRRRASISELAAVGHRGSAGDGDRRPRQTEHRLQQPMHAGRVEEIEAAHDVRHALQRVVEHHGEVIARGISLRPGSRRPSVRAGCRFRAGPPVSGPGQRYPDTGERGRISRRNAYGSPLSMRRRRSAADNSRALPG